MSAGGGSSSSQSESGTDVWGVQVPYLQDLYGQAQTQFQATQPQIAGMAARAGSVLDPLMRNLISGAGAFANPQAQIDAQSRSLESGLGRLFSEQINPNIRTDAIAAGGMGGGRQGVAEGVAAGQLADTYAQSLGDITARANSQALQATAMQGALAGQYAGMPGQLAASSFGPLAAYASILGAPTLLPYSRSSSKSSEFKFGVPGF